MPVWYFDTDIGRMGLAAQNGAVTRLYFRIEEAALTEETAPIPDEPTGFHKKVERQIKEYLAGKRREFTLPVEPEEGTPFMKRVWEALRSVPFG
ncbi:MAG: cysteine methyltransferase, partial [Fibrobacter sp.]|nr:cysteine methyltransferase [Fibrobacter sp.]